MSININIGSTGGNNPARRSGLDPSESSQITTDSNKNVSSPASSSKNDSTQPVQPVEDRVEISKAAKQKAGDEEKRARDLSFARKALLSIPPLTDEKVEELQMRIKERYYSQPEVVRDTAEQMTNELSDRS